MLNKAQCMIGDFCSADAAQEIRGYRDQEPVQYRCDYHRLEIIELTCGCGEYDCERCRSVGVDD